MRNICTAVRRLALDYPDVEIVYPVHLSPVVRSTAEELLGGVFFLTDDKAASAITGVVLPIDCGFAAYSGV